MEKDSVGGPDDQGPRPRKNGPAPPKKPLTQFLAEFEQRLLEHPEESPTSALQVVEDRAGGQRQQAAQSAVWRAPLAPVSVQGSAAAAAPAPIATPPPPPVVQPKIEAPPGAGEAEPQAEEPPPAAGEVGEASESAETVSQSRRLRGRRRRRHRHRAR